MTAGKFTIELTPDLPVYTADQDVLVTMSSVDANDAPADAGEVTLTVVRPDGAQIEYTLSGGDLTHPATGVYQRTVTMNMADDWIFHVQGSTLICAAQRSATIDPATILDDSPPPLPVPGAGNEGKIARVTGGNYVPYGGGADEQPLVWRVGTGWVGQALNLAAAAAVSGLLALSHLTPGTNGQFLSTVGGVATWVASPATPPGGATPQVQYNNGGVFDGAAGIVVAGTENALAFGTSPAQTLGDLRHAHGAIIIAGRNNAASGDVPIVRWGTAGTDMIYLGSTSSDAVQAASLRLGVGTGGDFRFEVNGVAEYNADATALTMNGNNLLMGAGFVSFGTNPATVGSLRGPNGAAIILASRNNANTQDISLVRVGQFSTDQVGIGDDNNANGLRFATKTATNFDFTINGGLEYQFTSAQLNWNANNSVGAGFYSGGGTVAASGVFRGANNATLVAARNAGNTADVVAVAVDASDIVVLGGAGTPNATRIYANATTNFTVAIGGTDKYVFDTSKLDMKAQVVQFGTNPAAAAGLIRVPHGGGINVLAGRNSANSGDVNLLGWGTDGTNLITFGGGLTSGSIYNTGGNHDFWVSAVSEYTFNSTTADFKDNVLQFGTNPASTGTVRFPNLATIYARNSGNTANMRMIEMGDNISFGDQTNTGTIFYDVKTGGLHALRVNGTGEYTFSSTVADFKDNALQFGTNPAASGLVRAPNNGTIVAARNAANSGDIVVLNVDSSNRIHLGDVSGGGLNHPMIDAANNLFSLAAMTLDMTSAVVDWNRGGGSAATGINRLSHNMTGGWLVGRNNAGTQDVKLLEWGVISTDVFSVGPTANGKLLFNNVNTAFFGGTPASKQTVTGSRSANAALASLLTALSTYGLLTDSSTA